jgi:hypothetical protein
MWVFICFVEAFYVSWWEHMPSLALHEPTRRPS